MTVAELIRKLQEVEDSSKEVMIQSFDFEMFHHMEDFLRDIEENNGYLYLKS